MDFVGSLSGPMPRKEAILTRDKVESMIANGRTIIIVDGKVLKVDSWLNFHPGGEKVIMHLVGRDATDEVNGYGYLRTVRLVYLYY